MHQLIKFYFVYSLLKVYGTLTFPDKKGKPILVTTHIIKVSLKVHLPHHIYYIILYYIILYYIILYYIIFFYIILYYIFLYYIILYFFILYYIILYPMKHNIYKYKCVCVCVCVCVWTLSSGS